MLAIVSMTALYSMEVRAAPPALNAPDELGAFVVALADDGQGHIWAGTEDAGVWRYAPAAAGQQWTQFTTANGLGDDDAHAVACDRLGRVWVGHLNHGVSVFNGAQWKNYGMLEGLPGERVFDIAICPTDGDVWIATSAGLARYSLQRNEWRSYTRAEGVPTDQIAALAFDAAGNVYAGTQCDGIAIARADDNYASWRTVAGPPLSGATRMPTTATGTGLPSSLINDLLVMRDGSLCAATAGGLARSADGGNTWYFIRGQDWEDNVRGLYKGPEPAPSEVRGDFLMEDWVTCLAEDESGALWIGYRQKGFEVRDLSTNGRIFWSGDDALNAASNDFVRAILARPGVPPLIARYGSSGAGLAAAMKYAAPVLPAPLETAAVAAAFPAAATVTAAELKAALQRVRSLAQPMQPGEGAYLGEDWRTRGDWVGRYGREYAVLCAMQSPGDHTFTGGGDYRVDSRTGPHCRGGSCRYSYIYDLRTDNPKALYGPRIGTRRQAEWNDGSWDEGTYPRTYEGPDLWVNVTVPAGTHRVSLYFYNSNGHTGSNRLRDYVLELKRYQADIEAAEAAPALARTRVRDFWGGVYKQFVVMGPERFSIKIGRNHSHATILQAVLLDRLPMNTANPRTWAAPWWGGERYAPPTVEPLAVGATAADTAAGADAEKETLQAARELWARLDEAHDQAGGAALQWPLRLMAYRAAAASGGRPALLANWRWHLALWQQSDRAEFQRAMARAYEGFNKSNPR